MIILFLILLALLVVEACIPSGYTHRSSAPKSFKPKLSKALINSTPPNPIPRPPGKK